MKDRKNNVQMVIIIIASCLALNLLSYKRQDTMSQEKIPTSEQTAIEKQSVQIKEPKEESPASAIIIAIVIIIVIIAIDCYIVNQKQQAEEKTNSS